MRFMGIDPGATGAIAICTKLDICTSITWQWYCLPTIEVKKGRYELDLHAVCALLEKEGSYKLPYAQIAVEEPPFIPTNGGFAIRSLFKTYGELRGILTHRGENVVYVNPKVWKATILPGKSKDKVATIAYVKSVYPDIQLPAHPKHPKKLHDGVADAICLVDYARTHFYSQNNSKP